MSYREILGVIAVIITIVSYILYLKDILVKKTKPHTFSWLVWTLLTGIAFFGQLAGGAGAGAWVNGFSTLFCFAVFILSFKYGSSDIVFLDWICLFGSFVAILLWIITKEPLLSIILVTITDALGYIPTFRKSFHRPHEEMTFAYFLGGLKNVFALFALNTVSIVTALFPAYLVIANWIFVLMVLARKKRLRL